MMVCMCMCMCVYLFGPRNKYLLSPEMWRGFTFESILYKYTYLCFYFSYFRHDFCKTSFTFTFISMFDAWRCFCLEIFCINAGFLKFKKEKFKTPGTLWRRWRHSSVALLTALLSAATTLSLQGCRLFLFFIKQVFFLHKLLSSWWYLYVIEYLVLCQHGSRSLAKMTMDRSLFRSWGTPNKSFWSG